MRLHRLDAEVQVGDLPGRYLAGIILKISSSRLILLVIACLGARFDVASTNGFIAVAVASTAALCPVMGSQNAA